jgi:hypothetical protein
MWAFKAGVYAKGTSLFEDDHSFVHRRRYGRVSSVETRSSVNLAHVVANTGLAFHGLLNVRVNLGGCGEVKYQETSSHLR